MGCPPGCSVNTIQSFVRISAKTHNAETEVVFWPFSIPLGISWDSTQTGCHMLPYLLTRLLSYFHNYFLLATVPSFISLSFAFLIPSLIHLFLPSFFTCLLSYLFPFSFTLCLINFNLYRNLHRFPKSGLNSGISCYHSLQKHLSSCLHLTTCRVKCRTL
jgi:hypothetical protein